MVRGRTHIVHIRWVSSDAEIMLVIRAAAEYIAHQRSTKPETANRAMLPGHLTIPSTDEGA
jgi:hypothetical protein